VEDLMRVKEMTKMSKKATVLRALTDYFMEKGEILDKNTYAKQPDTPIPPRNVKRILGNWSRLPRMIKVNFPEDYDKIMGKDVVEDKPDEAEQARKEAAKALLASLAKVKEASKPKVEVKKDEK
jgi:hypothetical protein